MPWGASSSLRGFVHGSPASSAGPICLKCSQSSSVIWRAISIGLVRGTSHRTKAQNIRQGTEKAHSHSSSGSAWLSGRIGFAKIRLASGFLSFYYKEQRENWRSRGKKRRLLESNKWP